MEWSLRQAFIGSERLQQIFWGLNKDAVEMEFSLDNNIRFSNI